MKSNKLLYILLLLVGLLLLNMGRLSNVPLNQRGELLFMLPGLACIGFALYKLIK